MPLHTWFRLCCSMSSKFSQHSDSVKLYVKETGLIKLTSLISYIKCILFWELHKSQVKIFLFRDNHYNSVNPLSVGKETRILETSSRRKYRGCFLQSKTLESANFSSDARPEHLVCCPAAGGFESLTDRHLWGSPSTPSILVMFVVLQEEHSVTSPIPSVMLSNLKLDFLPSDKCKDRKLQAFLFCRRGSQKSLHSSMHLSLAFQNKSKQWGLTLNSRTSCLMFRHL